MSADHDFLNMTRRRFMELSGALLPAVTVPIMAESQSSSFSTLVVMIDDLRDDINPLFLNDILTEFFRRNIPVTCVVDFAALKSAQSVDLIAVINATMTREVGLFEIALAIDDAADERRYFQMRAAESLRAAAARAFADSQAHPIASVIDRRPADRIDLSAYRSAGFKVVIRPQQTGDLTGEFVGRRQLRLSGGSTLTLADPHPEFLADLSAGLAGGTDRMVVLSLANLSEDPTQTHLSQVSALATLIETEVASGAAYATRPLDYLLQFGPRPLTEIALVVAVGESTAERTASRVFVEALAAKALPVTVVAASRPGWLSDSTAFCPIWPPAEPNFALDPETLPDCVLLTDPQDSSDLPAVSVVLVGGPDDWSWNGLRADGRMQLALSDWREVELSGGMTRDRQSVLIRPADIATPRQQESVHQQILTAQQTGRVHFHTVASLAHDLLAPDPVLTRLWTTRRRKVTDPIRTARMTKVERDDMRDDATLAWQFIDRFTSPLTGLCAGTVRIGPDTRINREATFWDLASQMQGIIAAVALNIIPQPQAKDRLAAMLANVPVTSFDGLDLPPAMFMTDTTKVIVTPGFDICDTGRFLIALRAAVGAGLVSAKMATATVKLWTLDAAVQNRRAFNHDGTNWQDSTDSHCTPYIGRAFTEIGLPMASPYVVAGAGSATDDLIRLLYAAAAIGSYGTEPLLLEDIELGASAHSAFLADVLFDAQLTWFETTGQLKCVSESPLNRPPWFIFQGLRVDRLGAEAWTIKGLDRSEEFQTEAFQRDAEVISTKSAYLWAATHPHPYSDRLIRLIRSKARIEDFGFSVGVFARTLMPMENYSDLNTNGIILTAIASMLDRR